MTVTPIDNSNGILLLKQGSVLKQVDTFNLICSYNISYLETTTNKIAVLYASTKSLDSAVVSRDLHKSYTDQIEHKINIISNKLIFLAPKIRVKRGLINGLGSLVKAVTGNLDYNDAIRIEQQISNINNRVQNVQEKSVVLAQRTISEFSNQIDKINENQHTLGLMLQNISTHTNIVYRQFNLLQVHIELDFSLQVILDKLMLLEDAMTFAQIGIMHPSIINTNNLISEMLDIDSKYTFTPVAPINIENIHSIEKSIEVKAYSTDISLNFILEIPSVETTPYDLVHIYSIPNEQNVTIIPKSKYLVLGGGEYTYMDEECRRITKVTHICKQLTMKPLQGAEDCITSIVQHKVDHLTCSYAKTKIKNGKLQSVTSNSWLFITNTREVLKSTCGSEITYHTLIGAQLIEISNGCRAQVSNITLQTHSNTVNIYDVIPLPKGQLPPTTIDETRLELQLEEVSLDNVHRLVNNAKNIINEDRYEDSPISITPSWTTIILYLIGAGLLCWKIYRCCTKEKRTPPPEPAGGPARTSGTRFYLKEGGVTVP